MMLERTMNTYVGCIPCLTLTTEVWSLESPLHQEYDRCFTENLVMNVNMVETTWVGGVVIILIEFRTSRGDSREDAVIELTTTWDGERMAFAKDIKVTSTTKIQRNCHQVSAG